MKRIIPLIFMLSSVGLISLWADTEAVLSALKGKVEVRSPGSKVWVVAREGQVLSLAATVSTGFDSSAVITIGDNVIRVKALTRMAIDNLATEGNLIKTSAFLRVGTVAASVKSIEGVKQDFKVQSPYSTASVRGTEFEYDGLKLKVKEGVVAMQMGRSSRNSESANDDFVGAPDFLDEEGSSTVVQAGQNAELKINYSSQSSNAKSSDDLDVLRESTGINSISNQADNGVKGNVGSIKLSITFGQ